MKMHIRAALTVMIYMVATIGHSAERNVEFKHQMSGFDAYMRDVLAKWNCPGIGIGIVVDDRLVFAHGYGYRDYGKKLPFTANTLFPIGSDTKLFTAVAAGMLVVDGKLTWDRPVRDSVPTIRFYNDELNSNITLRDMLSHRTGIPLHRAIWYTTLTSDELFDKLQYLEPKAPLRQKWLYNNVMYGAVGRIVEMQSGISWRDFIRSRILLPLSMDRTIFTVADMAAQTDHGVPFNEYPNSTRLYQAPYSRDAEDGLAPAGSIISSVDDLSHWLIALMNEGVYKGRSVLPSEAVKATLQPAIANPSSIEENHGWREVLGRSYGMGRETAVYRGHLVAMHGGDIGGFHSQISMMPAERLGVIVLVIGNQAATLYNPITYNIYERLLGMDQRPWTDRFLKVRNAEMAIDTARRSTRRVERIPGTNASHPLDDFVGEYVNPLYGVLTVRLVDAHLELSFHHVRMRMEHFHYDRFDGTDDDEPYGHVSTNFGANFQGNVDRLTLSMAGDQETFVRQIPLSAPPTSIH